MNESLAVILPIFNEEKVIRETISNSIVFCRNKIDDFEIIAVDDGSTDSTLELLYEQQHIYPELKIISHERNRGYGCAIRSGVNCVKKEWILIMDADGQFHIDDFEKYWQHRNGYDCIVGYRENRQDNLYRIILGKIGNLISNVVLRKKIIDINCGFKLFKAQILQGMKLKSTGGIINFEIMHNLFKDSRIRFTQVPTKHYSRKKGKSTGGRFRVIIKIIFEGLNAIFGQSGSS
jgi:glycosyltransferase involved in cell wall biosynthesis